MSLQKQKYFVPFSLFGNEDRFLDWPFGRAGTCSHCSMWEDESTVTVEAAVPGMSVNDIQVHCEKNVLTIQATRKTAEEDKKRNYFHKMDQSFTYQLNIPGEVDQGSEQAELKDGILKVTFKKSKKAMPKQIQIKQK